MWGLPSCASRNLIVLSLHCVSLRSIVLHNMQLPPCRVAVFAFLACFHNAQIVCVCFYYNTSPRYMFTTHTPTPLPMSKHTHTTSSVIQVYSCTVRSTGKMHPTSYPSLMHGIWMCACPSHFNWLCFE